MEQSTMRRMSLGFRRRHRQSRVEQEFAEKRSDQMHLALSLLTFAVAILVAFAATSL